MVPILDFTILTYCFDSGAGGRAIYLYADLVLWIFEATPFFVFFYALIFVACHSAAPNNRLGRWAKECWIAPVLLLLVLVVFMVGLSVVCVLVLPDLVLPEGFDVEMDAEDFFLWTGAGLTFLVVWGFCAIYALPCFGIAFSHLLRKT